MLLYERGKSHLFVRPRSAHKKERARPISGCLSLPCEPSGKRKGYVLHLRDAMSHIVPSVRCGHMHERVLFLRLGPPGSYTIPTASGSWNGRERNLFTPPVALQMAKDLQIGIGTKAVGRSASFRIFWSSALGVTRGGHVPLAVRFGTR